MLKQDARELSYEFLEELRIYIPELPPERAKILINSLVNVSERISAISKNNPLSFQASFLAKHMVVELLD